MTRRKRRFFSPEEKITLIKKHLLEKTPVSDICDQFDLQPVVFYSWQKQFLEHGTRAFASRKDGTVRTLEKQVSQLSAKLRKKDEVMFEWK